MKLEELIYSRFVNSEALVGHLAKFGGSPAVFSPDPPDENQEGWGDNPQYPKVIYNFDLQANEERHSAGTLSVSLLCQNTMAIMPEEIEPIVRDCLRDVILKPDGGTPYCFAWARTDAFSIEEKKGDVTIGSEIRFDILEYPSQETTDPDPVVALNQYIKERIPEAFVLGLDELESLKAADAKAPVFYCRLETVEKDRETNTVAWMNGRIVVHVICADISTRMKWIMSLANSLSLDGEVVMLDKSPMRIKRLVVNNKADYLKEGQLAVTVHYGLLRYKAKAHVIVEANFDFK